MLLIPMTKMRWTIDLKALKITAGLHNGTKSKALAYAYAKFRLCSLRLFFEKNTSYLLTVSQFFLD